MAAERNVYERPDGTWGWRLTSGSDIIATDGGQGYEDEDFCREMADRIIGGEYRSARKITTRLKKKA